MAVAARATLKVSLDLYEAAAGTVSTVARKTVSLIEREWLEGVTATTVDEVAFAQTTANGDTDVDLAGVLTDLEGNAITFAEIAFIIVEHRGTSGTINVGGDATAPFVDIFAGANDEIVIGAGGFVVLCARDDTYTPVATTGDILEITTSESLTFRYYIGGRSS